MDTTGKAQHTPSNAPTTVLARQQQERARLERQIMQLREELVTTRQLLQDSTERIKRTKRLIRAVFARRSLDKQTIPDILYAVEYYIGGMTESRIDRQLRSEGMIQTSILLREMMLLALDHDLDEEV